MKSGFFKRSAASLVLGGFLLGPALCQQPARESFRSEVPLSAVVETIEFKGISQETQRVVLDRIGVRPGDMLTAEARQWIGRELGRIQKGLTFTYRSGAKPRTAKLIISGDC